MKEKWILRASSQPSAQLSRRRGTSALLWTLGSKLQVPWISSLPSPAVSRSPALFWLQFDTCFCHRTLTEEKSKQQFFPVILYLSGKLWIVRDSSHLAPQILRGAVHRIQPCPFSWFLVSNPNRFWKKYSLEWFKILVFFFLNWSIVDIRGFPRGSDSKESACHEGDLGLIWSGRPPGEGNGNPLQYCCRGQRSLAGYSPWGHEESDMIVH